MNECCHLVEYAYGALRDVPRLGEDRRRGAGRGDDDVAGAERGVELFPGRGGGAADGLGGSCGMGERATDDSDALRTLRPHVLRGELAHFPSAYNQHAPSGQRAENLAGKRYRRKADRDCT